MRASPVWSESVQGIRVGAVVSVAVVVMRMAVSNQGKMVD
jgi:hypothetical protein